MVFKKTGDAEVAKIYCPCGGEIVNGKCSKCSKETGQDQETDEKEKKDG